MIQCRADVDSSRDDALLMTGAAVPKPTFFHRVICAALFIFTGPPFARA